MSFLFECPQCTTRRVVAIHAVGRRVRCPACEALVEITLPDDQAAGSDKIVPLEPVRRGQTSEAAESSLTVISGVAISAPALQPDWHHDSNSSSDRIPGVPVLALADDEADEPIQLRSRPEEAEMDMTPMVDVTFQLLIFFMVTASFTMQKSLPIPATKESQAAAARSVQEYEEDPAYMTVRVDQFGTFFVTAAQWDDEVECPSEQELLVKLREGRLGGASGDAASKMLVLAHGDAVHSRIVLALDAGVSAGFNEVQLASIEDDDQD
jgi:biopolymer transport protein ExbD